MARKSLELIDRWMDQLLVRPGKKVSLRKDFDPDFGRGKLNKEEAEALLAEGVELLANYQDRLYAQDRYALLIIFQAMDAAGKDGTIKHVMSGINPQGCEVTSFKAPSAEELDHDYLWRCFRRLPGRGSIGIFNRSYYEEVLVVRVHPEILEHQKLPQECKDRKIWQRRFEQINNFERYLHENGTVVLKFFLNVSKKEQKKRFLERLDRPEKNWKFSATDAKERRFWNDYMRAYQDILNETSTKAAPWHVVPADDKPFMRVAVAGVIVKALKSLKLEYPTVSGTQKEDLMHARELLDKEK